MARLPDPSLEHVDLHPQTLAVSWNDLDALAPSCTTATRGRSSGGNLSLLDRPQALLL